MLLVPSLMMTIAVPANPVTTTASPTSLALSPASPVTIIPTPVTALLLQPPQASFFLQVLHS